MFYIQCGLPRKFCLIFGRHKYLCLYGYSGILHLVPFENQQYLDLSTTNPPDAIKDYSLANDIPVRALFLPNIVCALYG